MTIGSDFKQRHLSVRVLAKKFGRAAFTFENVDFDQFVRNAKPGQREADLVAVAGTLHRIERVHLQLDPLCDSSENDLG